jgi:hypothetical protein
MISKRTIRTASGLAIIGAGIALGSWLLGAEERVLAVG